MTKTEAFMRLDAAQKSLAQRSYYTGAVEGRKKLLYVCTFSGDAILFDEPDDANPQFVKYELASDGVSAKLVTR